MKKFSAFTYLDVISGLTVILIVLGSIYGAIRLVEKTTQENTLVSRIDSFANWIFEEINLRKFDENIESIEENGLTLNFGTEADENINNLSSLDDIDDFVTEDLRNTAFPQLEANIIVNYVDIDLETNSIIPSVNPTTLKRVKLNIRHPSFDSPINYTKIFAGNFDPELLIIRSYPVGITVNRSSDQINLLEVGASLTFTVEFSSEVFVTENANSEFYIDIKSGVLAGSEGSYNIRPSNPGEVKASFLGGSGTRFLTFLLTNSDELQLSGSDLDDYIGYRPNLVIQNGSVRDIEGVEVLYGLPNEGEAASFTSNVNILPLLQEWNTLVYTTADELAFNDELAVVFIPQTAREIFDDWPRAEKTHFWENREQLDENPPDWWAPDSYDHEWATRAWEFMEDPDRVNQPTNSSFLNTFLSQDSLENYTFESTLYSASTWDDDVNGLVLAYDQLNFNNTWCSALGAAHDIEDCDFVRRPWSSREDVFDPRWANTRVNNFLLLIRHTGGFSRYERFSVYNVQWRIHNNYEESKYTKVASVEIPVDNQITKWQDRPYTRVKAVRDGNNFTIWTTPFSTEKPDPENPAYFQEPITFNLESQHHLHRYKGKTRYGYCNHSQELSEYYDNILSGGTLDRLNFQILFDLDSGDVTRYYKKTDGDPIEQNVARLQSDAGYLRPLYNEKTRKKYLLMRDRIIEYPFNED